MWHRPANSVKHTPPTSPLPSRLNSSTIQEGRIDLPPSSFPLTTEPCLMLTFNSYCVLCIVHLVRFFIRSFIHSFIQIEASDGKNTFVDFLMLAGSD